MKKGKPNEKMGCRHQGKQIYKGDKSEELEVCIKESAELIMKIEKRAF